MSVKANASRRQMTPPTQYVNDSWTIICNHESSGAKSRATLMLSRLWYLLQRCGLSSWPCRQPVDCWRSVPRPLPQTPTLSRCLRATCKVSASQILVVPTANLYEKDRGRQEQVRSAQPPREEKGGRELFSMLTLFHASSHNPSAVSRTLSPAWPRRGAAGCHIALASSISSHPNSFRACGWAGIRILICIFSCVYIYMYLHTQNIHTHNHTHTHTHARTHDRTHSLLHTNTHTQTHAQTHIHIHKHIHKHTHTNTHTQIHTHTQTHTHTHTHICARTNTNRL